MNREIIFKAKDLNGNWLIGDIFNATSGLTIIQNGGSSRSDFSFIKADTVCQYIGQKDKNGNKIFENDYYRTEDEDNNTWFTVCVYVKEIASFCWLVDYEYLNYIDNGFDSLEDNGVPFNCDQMDLDLISISGNIIDNDPNELIQRTDEV